MKNIIKIVLLITALILSYLIFSSVSGLVDFNKEKMVRYAKAVEQLEEVADAERLYKGYHGKYTDNLDSLKNYVENGKILMINRKDSSGYVYDEKTRIDVMKSFTLIDTIMSKTTVKDSLFRNRSLDNFGYVSVNGEKKPIKLYASFSDRIVGNDSTNIQTDHFFKAWIAKDEVLAGLGDDYIQREMNDETSPVKDEVLQVGSDARPTLEGNWSTEIDAFIKEKRAKASK